MNYGEYTIPFDEFLQYKKKKKSLKLDEIWNDMIARINDKNLKSEANAKGYKLVENPDMEEDVIAQYMMFQIPKASEKLNSYVIENLYPFVVLLKE